MGVGWVEGSDARRWHLFSRMSSSSIICEILARMVSLDSVDWNKNRNLRQGVAGRKKRRKKPRKAGS